VTGGKDGNHTTSPHLRKTKTTGRSGPCGQEKKDSSPTDMTRKPKGFLKQEAKLLKRKAKSGVKKGSTVGGGGLSTSGTSRTTRTCSLNRKKMKARRTGDEVIWIQTKGGGHHPIYTPPSSGMGFRKGPPEGFVISRPEPYRNHINNLRKAIIILFRQKKGESPPSASLYLTMDGRPEKVH